MTDLESRKTVQSGGSAGIDHTAEESRRPAEPGQAAQSGRSEQSAQLEREAAAEIVEVARARILAQERYLDSALYALKPAAAPESTPDYAVDGRRFLYSPGRVIQDYEQNENAVCRAYMHALLHVIFLHPFSSGLPRQDLWDLSCDLAVEGIILSQGKPCFRLERDAEQRRVISRLQERVGMLTAERIYRYLFDEAGAEELASLKRLAALFRVDTHRPWHEMDMAELMRFLNGQRRKDYGKSNSRGSDGFSGEENVRRPQGSETERLRDSNGSGSFDDGRYEDGAAYRSLFEDQVNQQLSSIWADRSGYILSQMKTGARGRTDEAGWLMQELSEMQRKPQDYRSFLMKFAKREPAVKPSMEEFNPILYTYGLQMYGNLPLIEEAETSQEKQIRDFIIAIDTSGSTSGALVQDFLRETCGILMNKEVFSERMNLHIVQCDARIQEATVIRSRTEIDRAVKNMTVKGLGGTDFRPVFAYADRMRKAGKINHLQGLLYFTDGRGIYPKKRPDYKTAFVFLRKELDAPEVPPWAYQVIWER